MKKKVLATLLTAALVMSIMAGCGSEAPEKTTENDADVETSETAAEDGAAQDDSGTETAGNGEKTVINFYYSTDMEKTVAPMVEAFNAANDEVEVVPNSIPEGDYDDKVKVMTAGGSDEADVFWLRSPASMAQYMENGVFVDLKPYADATGIDLTSIKDTSLAGVTDENGSFYGYPDKGTCWMLFYNKDLFDAKNLEYPENLTWTEYLDLIKSLTGEENGTKYWGGLSPIWTPNLGAIAAGEYLDDEALAKTKEYAQIQHRMYVEDASAPGIAEMTSGTFDINEYFQAGNIYTMVNGDWSFRILDPEFEYGAAPLPILDGMEKETSVGQASYLAIPVASKNPEAAYKFIEFYCTSPEGTSIIAQNGDVPAYTTQEALAVYKEQVNVPGVDYRFTAKVLDEQRSLPTYTSLIEAYSQELQLYLLDEQSLDETFDNFAKLREEIASE